MMDQYEQERRVTLRALGIDPHGRPIRRRRQRAPQLIRKVIEWLTR